VSSPITILLNLGIEASTKVRAHPAEAILEESNVLVLSPTGSDNGVLLQSLRNTSAENYISAMHHCSRQGVGLQIRSGKKVDFFTSTG
jgi:hypothetical protein